MLFGAARLGVTVKRSHHHLLEHADHGLSPSARSLLATALQYANAPTDDPEYGANLLLQQSQSRDTLQAAITFLSGYYLEHSADAVVLRATILLGLAESKLDEWTE